jgi:hypothetical protein
MWWRSGIFEFWVLGGSEMCRCKSLACGGLSVIGTVVKLVQRRFFGAVFVDPGECANIGRGAGFCVAKGATIDEVLGQKHWTESQDRVDRQDGTFGCAENLSAQFFGERE